MSELSASNEWRTNPRTFGQWHALYGFEIDGAAAAWNRQLPHFWNKKTNGLRQDDTGKRIWCNPPYSNGNLMRWSSHALKGALKRNALWGLHVPASTSDGWWWKNVAVIDEEIEPLTMMELYLPGVAQGYRRTWAGLLTVDVWFYKGRQRHKEKSGATGSARHHSAFIVYAGHHQWLPEQWRLSGYRTPF